MNNKLSNELFLSAAQYAVDHTNNQVHSYENVLMQKYAELIINKCCQALWTEECHTSDLAYSEWIAQCNAIKEDLGVA